MISESEVWKICDDLERLVTVAGPTQSSVRMSVDDPRILRGYRFPAQEEVERMAQRMGLDFREDCGNVVLVGGVKDVEDSKIKDIPVTLGAHLDEITYLISHKRLIGKSFVSKGDIDNRVIVPICRPPRPLEKETYQIHSVPRPTAEIIGFRDGRLSRIGQGHVGYYLTKEEGKKDPKTWYIIHSVRIESGKEIREGDVVLQKYEPLYVPDNRRRDIDSVFHAKALDDRVGCVTVMWALNLLDKMKIPAKAILTTSEEGVPSDVSWGRLIRPTFRKYCREDGITLICDGVDGKNLLELESNGNYVSEAVVAPYTGDGKGGGDIGVFSALRDHVIPRVNESEKRAITSTDYFSRSFDPKIMDDFPLIGNISWVNGKAGDSNAVCHEVESVKIRQVVNIIHTLMYATAFFDNKMTGKPNSLFK